MRKKGIATEGEGLGREEWAERKLYVGGIKIAAFVNWPVRWLLPLL